MAVRGIRAFLWILALLGAVASVPRLLERACREGKNTQVGIAIDYDEVQTVARESGKTVLPVLKTLRKAGATMLVLREDTVASLEAAKRLQIRARSADELSLIVLETGPSGEALRSRLAAALNGRIPRVYLRFPHRGEITVNRTMREIRDFGIGLDPHKLALAGMAGLGVVAQIGNYREVRPAGIYWTLLRLKKAGVSVVAFQGETLGWEGYIDPLRRKVLQRREPTLTERFQSMLQRLCGQKAFPQVRWEPQFHGYTAPTFDDLGMYVAVRERFNGGAVENATKRGEDTLAQAIPHRVVRAHLISDNERSRTGQWRQMVDRYLLAARERNVRLLMVGLFQRQEEAIEANQMLLAAIRSGLDRSSLLSLSPGPVHGYEMGAPSPWTFLCRAGMAVGIFAALLLALDGLTQGWILSRVLPLLAPVGIPLFAIVLLTAGYVAGSADGMVSSKAAAFLAACLFPVLALTYTDLSCPAHYRGGLGGAFARFILSSGITLMGALMASALLTDVRFLVRADAFPGVKMALALPVLLVAAGYLLRWASVPGDSLRENLRNLRTRLSGLSRAQVTLLALGAALLLVIVMRSGNDSDVGLFPGEETLRSLLQTLLPVRPRTKELIGHLLLFTGMALASGKTPRSSALALPLIALGVIGQVSLMNTFLHLHTPLVITLCRVGTGLLLGAAGALLLYIVAPIFAAHAGKQQTKASPDTFAATGDAMETAERPATLIALGAVPTESDTVTP